MTNKEFTVRNGQIVRLRRAGFTFKKIGDQFSISKERVRQIVLKHERKERAKILRKALPEIDKSNWDDFL